MKRIHLLVGAGLVFGLGTPIAVVLAVQTFVGPPNCSTPPCNNVPGVIWNVNGTSAFQPNAQADFTGTNWATYPTVKSDLGLATGKALRIDVNGNATFNVGNWGGTISPFTKPLIYGVTGGIKATPIASPTAVMGEDGRVQAYKFCFDPVVNGIPQDCITAWPSGVSGLYVLKTGDAMTGRLSITTNSTTQASLDVINNGTGSFGVVGSAPVFGTGGSFSGGSFGLVANSLTGIALVASSSKNGEFALQSNSGRGVGILGTGRDGGVRGSSPNGTGVEGNGNVYGIVGTAVLDGVYGRATDLTNGAGGSFIAPMWGVTGTATGATGYGGYFTGPAGGVVGTANAPGWAAGVLGFDSDPSVVGALAFGGYGAVGQGPIGVYANGLTGDGVYALGAASSAGVEATGAGFVGDPLSDTLIPPNLGSMGVFAVGPFAGVMAKGNSVGLYGMSVNPPGGVGGAGVTGWSMATSGQGLSGLAQGTSSYGVEGYSTNNLGKGGYLISNGIGSVSIGLPFGAVAISTSTLSSNPDTYWPPAAANGSGLYARGTTYGVYSDGPSKFTGANDPLVVIDSAAGVNTAIHFRVNGVTKDYIWSNNTNGDLNIGTPAKNPTLTVKTGGGVLMTNYTQFVSPDGTKNWQLDTNNAGDFEIIPSVGGALKRLWLNGTTGDLSLLGGTAYKPGGGSWVVPSDARLKDVGASFTRGLDALMSINPVHYHYKVNNAMGVPSGTEYIGVVAQNVQQAIPEAVTTNEKGFLTVNNDPIIWTMLNSIKELKAENDDLRARVEALEAK